MPLSLVKVLFCSIFSSFFIVIWHRNQTQSFPVAHFQEWLSIILEEKMDQGILYHFTTLERLLLLFWEVITNIVSLREMPLPLPSPNFYPDLPFLLPLLSLFFSIWILFPMCFLSLDFSWQRQFKESI